MTEKANSISRDEHGLKWDQFAAGQAQRVVAIMQAGSADRMTVPVRVLLVEDNEDDALLLLDALVRGGFTPDMLRVDSEKGLRDALTRGPWEVVIADYRLPHFNGLTALQILRESDAVLPFIMVSGIESDEFILQAIRAGAQDFIRKDQLVRLAPTVQRELRDVEIRRERQRAEEALWESETRFRSLFEESQAVMLLIDPETGRIVDANRAASAYYGYSHTRLCRMLILEINISPTEVVRTDMMRARMGEHCHFLFRHRLANGEEHPVEVFTGPVAIRGKTLLYSIIFDISARVRAEEERERLLERERRMLYTVAHDLRAPATIISGQVELLVDFLRGSELAAQLSPRITSLRRALRRMNTMVDNLTELTRMESGQLTLAPEPIPLPDFVDKLLQQYAEVLERVRITACLPANLPPVLAEPERLERILLNLLLNAQKYSAPGTPIRISAHQQGEYVKIAVTDEGQGIPSEDLPHVFDRFYRAARGRKAEGIGLGLYITRRLVEALGGHIQAESEFGKGSTLWFTLPVKH